MRNTITWDSLRRLHKINNHLSTVASEIEELGPNLLDVGILSEKLQAFSGITIWKLRDICDFMAQLEKMERNKADQFEKYLEGKTTRPEAISSMDYCI